MENQLFNMNGILGKNLEDIHDKYYIVKKDNETYDSNIKFYIFYCQMMLSTRINSQAPLPVSSRDKELFQRHPSGA